MPAQLGFLEDWLAIHQHFESTSPRRDHLDLRAGEALLDLRRQTGGARLVVSNDAVFDADLHLV
jgi:hypothetical protein